MPANAHSRVKFRGPRTRGVRSSARRDVAWERLRSILRPPNDRRSSRQSRPDHQPSSLRAGGEAIQNGRVIRCDRTPHRIITRGATCSIAISAIIFLMIALPNDWKSSATMTNEPGPPMTFSR